jgi:hypothetical protein
MHTDMRLWIPLNALNGYHLNAYRYEAVDNIKCMKQLPLNALMDTIECINWMP